MQPTVNTFHITTNSGHSRDWVKGGLTEQQQNDLNTIGYSGKLNGKPTTYTEYLETLSNDKLVFREVLLYSNNMDFVEKHLLIRVEIES